MTDPSIDDLVVREDIVDVEPLWMNWQSVEEGFDVWLWGGWRHR